MECIFLNAAGTTLFIRDDMESGHWVQQEMNLTADFPFDAGKKIQIGQRIAFRDPATDVIQVFEIKIVTNTEPDHYQQITAEHICISELTDEHINKTEIDEKTAAQALTTALTGTLWSVGNNSASGTQSADFSRGSVWDAVNTIQQNWNVYIRPRVVISSAGAITGRYLDIAEAHGTWNGVRLSVMKNLLDPSVTYDDSEVITAMYGYGGNVEVAQSGGAQDTTEELTFKDVVWSATSSHPAKPANQTYLEWPEKTALYGRNGRPRYGYYQNGSIKDADVLLQKTWESLQQSCDPKITISGTVVDLYRLGYKDQPISLHDIAIVEIEETGETFQKEIITADIDLIDPTGSRFEIGDYVANIVYINRDTNEKASGGGGGGGGKGSMTNLEDDDVKTWTEFVKTQNKVGMVVGTFNGTDKVLGGQIVLAINDDGGTTALIQADTIDIQGIVDALTAYDVTTETITTHNTANFGGEVTFNEGANFNGTDVTGIVNLTADYGTFDDVKTDTLTVNSQDATWQSETIKWISTVSGNHYFLYSNGSNDTTPSGTSYGFIVASTTQKTIHYLGKASETPS